MRASNAASNPITARRRRRAHYGKPAPWCTYPACALTAIALLWFTTTTRADDEKFVVIRAKKIIPVVGEEVQNGVVVIVDGKIRSVGAGLEYPKNATIIDAATETVMPGWIHPHTRWSLPTYSRNGVHGDLTTADELLPYEGQFDQLLEHGFTLAALYPDGAGAPGRAVVVRTNGDSPEEIVKSPSYLRVRMTTLPADKKTLREALKKAEQEIEKVEKARKEFEEKQEKAKQEAAKTDAESKPAEGSGKPQADAEKTPPASQPAASQPAEAKFEPPKIDPAHQPFVDLIQEKEGVRALVELDSPADHVHFLDAVGDFKFAHDLFMSNNGFYSDFGQIIENLAETKPRVVTHANIALRPYTANRISLPQQLADAGCEVALIPIADSREALDGFRAHLAELVRAGMPRTHVLESVTLHPARILGIDADYGSLEKDKIADVVFFDADALDPFARVTRVMIGGAIVFDAQEQLK